MYLLKPFSIIQRDRWVSGWLLWTWECYWVLVTDEIWMEVHSLSCSCPSWPHWTETLKQPHAKISKLCSPHRKNCPAFPMGGVLWDCGGRWRKGRKPRGRLTAGKVNHPLSLSLSTYMTHSIFFLNDIRSIIFLTISWSVLTHTCFIIFFNRSTNNVS